MSRDSNFRGRRRSCRCGGLAPNFFSNLRVDVSCVGFQDRLQAWKLEDVSIHSIPSKTDLIHAEVYRTHALSTHPSNPKLESIVGNDTNIRATSLLHPGRRPTYQRAYHWQLIYWMRSDHEDPYSGYYKLCLRAETRSGCRLKSVGIS